MNNADTVAVQREATLGKKKGGGMAGDWMKGAVKRPGVFKAKAQKAGMSTGAFAAKNARAPGRLGKQARLAQTFAKFRPK